MLAKSSHNAAFWSKIPFTSLDHHARYIWHLSPSEYICLTSNKELPTLDNIQVAGVAVSSDKIDGA